MSITEICQETARRYTPESVDWGFRFITTCEIDAFRLAYIYRDSPHGLKVETCPNIAGFSVTIWNERAKAMGLDA